MSTRGTTLAALVLAALVAPFAAAAATGGSDDDGHSHAAHHSAKPGHPGKPGHATGSDGDDKPSAAGTAHAEAMKKWARCVADAASGPKTGERTGPPKDACPDKPIGPGRAKHESDESAARGRSGDHRHGGHGGSGH
jgi:hypothetical protein